MNTLSVPWSRRPRAKVRNPLLLALGLFWIPVAFLVGLGVIIDDAPWWTRSLGGLVSALSLAVAVLVTKYLRRPVRTHDGFAPVDSDAVTDWDIAMSSTGRVEITLSPLKVFVTLGTIIGILLVTGLMASGVTGVIGVVIGIVVFIMMTFLGLVPHLQFVTGGRPAVLVDSAGIQIARWGRLMIPWSAVERVDVLQSTRRQANAIIQVTPTFYAQDLATRPSFRRLVEWPARSFAVNRYAIPSTTTANAQTLAAWLANEIGRRRGQI